VGVLEIALRLTTQQRDAWISSLLQRRGRQTSTVPVLPAVRVSVASVASSVGAAAADVKRAVCKSARRAFFLCLLVVEMCEEYMGVNRRRLCSFSSASWRCRASSTAQRITQHYSPRP
jgi:hypothetical protein